MEGVGFRVFLRSEYSASQEVAAEAAALAAARTMKELCRAQLCDTPSLLSDADLRIIVFQYFNSTKSICKISLMSEAGYSRVHEYAATARPQSTENFSL